MTSPSRKRLAVCALALALAQSCFAVDIKGAHFNDTYKLGNQVLQLNGAGIRVKLIVDVYAAGLYVPRKEHNAEALVSQPGPKSVQVVLLRDLTGDDFADAMVAGFKRNNSREEVAKHQARIEEIRNLMATFGSVKKGTSIHIDFTPGSGVQVSMNGVAKGEMAVGEDFFSAILRIWLGPKPVDDDLKDAMVGVH